MATQRIRLPHVATLAAALAVLATGPALAESACKGLEQALCEGKADCAWVNGYTRKDGVQVSGHCKSKGKRADSATKSKEGEPMTKPATAPGADTAAKTKAGESTAKPATPASADTGTKAKDKMPSASAPTAVAKPAMPPKQEAAQ